LVADLSHRLRTPITALRLDSEGLREPSEAARIGADVDALERAVDDVIQAARRQPVEDPAVDAVDVVGQRVAFWSALAVDQDRILHVRMPRGPLQVALSSADLGAAVDALIENALSYTPEGKAIHVSLDPRPAGRAVLIVEDEGPGFVGDPLARGTSGTGSTGLGLDIVRRTAQGSGGELRLGASEHGGASIRVELGSPRSPE
jgi:signal transduction histidine kinase